MTNPVRPAQVALVAQGRLPDGRWPPTERQTKYLRALQKRWSLSNSVFDSYCENLFGHRFRDIDKREASDLIEKMTTWESLPADVRRSTGQQGLPGV